MLNPQTYLGLSSSGANPNLTKSWPNVQGDLYIRNSPERYPHTSVPGAINTQRCVFKISDFPYRYLFTKTEHSSRFPGMFAVLCSIAILPGWGESAESWFEDTVFTGEAVQVLVTPEDKWSASWHRHWAVFFSVDIDISSLGMKGSQVSHWPITCAWNYSRSREWKGHISLMQGMTDSETQAGPALRQISQESLSLPSFDSSSSASIVAMLIITEGCRSGGLGMDSDTASV